MSGEHPRIAREKKTVAAMIEYYCKKQHSRPGGLCGDCSELLDYAINRLDNCTLQENKTTCAKCAVHCYKPFMRDRVRVVMRYSGPRMLFVHPILALRHIGDGFRKQQPSKNR